MLCPAKPAIYILLSTARTVDTYRSPVTLKFCRDDWPLSFPCGPYSLNVSHSGGQWDHNTEGLKNQFGDVCNPLAERENGKGHSRDAVLQEMEVVQKKSLSCSCAGNLLAYPQVGERYRYMLEKSPL